MSLRFVLVTRSLLVSASYQLSHSRPAGPAEMLTLDGFVEPGIAIAFLAPTRHSWSLQVGALLQVAMKTPGWVLVAAMATLEKPPVWLIEFVPVPGTFCSFALVEASLT